MAGMKVKLRLKAVRCPSCKGNGKFLGLDAPCMWCRGVTKISPKLALRFADHIWMIAGGGYINGDHDLKDMRKMEKEARDIYRFCGAEPKWEQ